LRGNVDSFLFGRHNRRTEELQFDHEAAAQPEVWTRPRCRLATRLTPK
jgi:hypothetical protein